LARILVASYSNSKSHIGRTIEAVDEALQVYKSALNDGTSKYFKGRPVKPVFRPYAYLLDFKRMIK